MKMNDLNISPNFFRVLRDTKISSSAYRLAMCLPELLQGEGVDLRNPPEGMSRSTFRKAIRELEMLYIIAPVGDKSSWYLCNPHLLWSQTSDWLLKLNRRAWNHMIEQRLQEC